jgi:hypothetical protein
MRKKLWEGYRSGPPEAWEVILPSLNSSAAVGRQKCLNLMALGLIRGSLGDATPRSFGGQVVHVEASMRIYR